VFSPLLLLFPLLLLLLLTSKYFRFRFESVIISISDTITVSLLYFCYSFRHHYYCLNYQIYNYFLSPETTHGKITRHYSRFYAVAFFYVHECELSHINPGHDVKLHPHRVKL